MKNSINLLTIKVDINEDDILSIAYSTQTEDMADFLDNNQKIVTNLNRAINDAVDGLNKKLSKEKEEERKDEEIKQIIKLFADKFGIPKEVLREF